MEADEESRDTAASQHSTKVCVICGKGFAVSDPATELQEKGCKKINSISKNIGSTVHAESGNVVHNSCRISFTHKRNKIRSLSTATPSSSPRKRRLQQSEAQQSRCVFCQQGEKRGRNNKGALIPVRTHQFQNTVAEKCRARNDAWGHRVAASLEYMRDCCAFDAVYHNACYANFGTGGSIPKLFSNEPTEPKRKQAKTVGRQENQIQTDAFKKVTQHLESQDTTTQITVSDLVDVMATVLKDSQCDSYTTKHMRRKLIEHYGDEVMFVKSTKADLVSLKRTADSILKEFYTEQRLSDPQEEKQRLIKAAASLIRNDIDLLPASKEVYPDASAITDHLNFVPESLREFLLHMTKKKNNNLKISAIAQAVIQMCRPNTMIAPLQIALAVQMHRSFASRFLVDTLHHLGFCSSYPEVRRFELNAAQSLGTDLPTDVTPDAHNIQFVCDNVDHNSVTIDGRNTFHGMGMMCTITPGVKNTRRIPRREVKLTDIKAIGQIDLLYRSGWNGLSEITFKEIPEILCGDDTANLDLLWKISWPLKSPYPNWCGMMQMVHDGDYPGKSSFVFLPMIDISSSDMSCIFSTLKFICGQAFKYGIPDTVVTFDQPLYFKAMNIITDPQTDEDVRKIVLRLGTFHLQLSFLGAIGHLMTGSGLQTVLEIPFAENAVKHILSGKAYARAVRAHLLTDAALNALLVAEAFDVPQVLFHPENKANENEAAEAFDDPQVLFHPENKANENEAEDVTADEVLPELAVEGGSHELKEDLGDESLNSALKILNGLLDGSMSAEDAASQTVFEVISKRLEQQKETLASKRTSALWMMYMKMVDILRQSIKAERTGNFRLHLESLQNMLPYLAAAGHNHYAKSGWLYLQQMLDLHNTHPRVHDFFSKGHHVIRRSERYWGGISTDLCIEQVLMKSLKSNGGLTRGTGFNEEERLVWLLCMPACGEVCEALQTLTDVASCSSEQHRMHKDVSKARQHRDHKDIQLILQYLRERNPFRGEPVLRSISSGRVPDGSVNAEQAEHIGKGILGGLLGKSVSDVTFKKKDQVVTMALKTKSPKQNDDIAYVDSTLLFQRLIQVAESTPDLLEEAFSFELSSVPTSLFDQEGLPRQANKASLANHIWKATKQTNASLPTGAHHVIDGGFLLHLVNWYRGSTYNKIVECYVDFVCHKFGKCTVVFDGYAERPNTKDVAHLRRGSKGNTACDVVFDGEMLLCDSKDTFLANPRNKERFITF